MRRARGFTLVELLAAAALFAVLGTLLFQVVRGAMDVWATGERNRELHDRAAAALDLLADDVRALWPGLPGAVEQDARLLCTWRAEDPEGDGADVWVVPSLAFARLDLESRTLDWLARAGDAPGGQAAVLRLVETDPATLRPTGGLAESLYTLAVLPGRQLPSLVRRVRLPLGGEGSLLDPELPERRDRLLQEAVPLADAVLWFGLEFWSGGTTAWGLPGGAPGAPATSWDSTRGILPAGDPGFPWGAGPASLLDARDDVFPRLLRATLVLAREDGEGGALAEALTADAGSLRLASTAFLRDQDLVDHLLVDGEWLAVTSRDGAVLGVQRGARGSRPAAHPAGSRVRAGRSFVRVIEVPVARDRGLR